MEASDSEPSTKSGIVKAILGLALLFVGWRLWQKRPRSGETAEAPPWMDSIDTFGVGKSLGMGFLLSAVNPKNLLLVAAAGVAISASDLSAGEQLAVLIVFTLIAASTVAVPVIGYLIAGERADETFAAAKTWLIQNNSIVMAVLMLVFGISLIGDAVQILL
jgi:threonine/homoserine/homoserine lactone efflux protein